MEDSYSSLERLVGSDKAMPPCRAGNARSSLMLSLGGGRSVHVMAGIRTDLIDASRGWSSGPMSGVVRHRYDHFEKIP